MTDPPGARHPVPGARHARWPLPVAVVAILAIALTLVATSKPPDPYQFLVDLGPRMASDERTEHGNFIQKPSRYRQLAFTRNKAAAAARAVEAKLRVASDYNNQISNPPAPGYKHYFEDANGSYVAVEILDHPHQIVMVDGLVKYTTYGECIVTIDQPIPHTGIGEAIRGFFHL